MLLFCAKTIVKESREFELAHLKKKKEHFGHLAHLQRFLAPLGVVRHENTQR